MQAIPYLIEIKSNLSWGERHEIFVAKIGTNGIKLARKQKGEDLLSKEPHSDADH